MGIWCNVVFYLQYSLLVVHMNGVMNIAKCIYNKLQSDSSR